jgi:hypothetical protein
MKLQSELKLQAFFDQFTEFTERASEHWPLKPPRKETQKETEIGYQFNCIITKEQLDDPRNETLLASFFSLYDNSQSTFSCGPTRTKEHDVKAQIKNLNDLKNCLVNPASGIYTFLVLGFKKNASNEVLVGCVGHYLPCSRSILVESIIMADKLYVEEDSAEDENQVEKTQRKLDENRQLVLEWLLTYGQKQKLSKGGLSQVVDFIEANVMKVPVKVDQDSKRTFPADAVFSVFHEALNPVLVFQNRVADDSTVDMEMRQRNASKVLLAFNNIESKFLKFAYRHPQVEQPFVTNRDRDFMLLTFPQVPKTHNYLTLETGMIMAFTIDYHRLINSKYVNYADDIDRCWNFTAGEEPDFNGYINHLGEDPIRRNSETLYRNRLSEKLTDIYLSNVPRLEQPRFSYKRASIGFEIIVDEDYFLPKGLNPYHHTIPSREDPTGMEWIWRWMKEKVYKRETPEDPQALYCQVAHSGETDLFAYKYQSEPPYFTRYYMLRASRVTIHFPSHFEFTSEGRAETFYCLPNSEEQAKSLIFENEVGMENSDKIETIVAPLPYFTYDIRVTACVSYTYFLNSAVRVWHLVLKPDEESTDGISELEIIKLMKFFSGSQEHESEEHRQNVMRQIKFTIDKPVGSFPPEENVNMSSNAKFDDEPDNLIKLLYDLTGITYIPNPKSRILRTHDKADEVVSLRNVRSGVVEIDTGGVTARPSDPEIPEDEIDRNNFLGFQDNPDAPAPDLDERNRIREKVQDLYESLYKDEVEMGDEPEPFSAEEYADYVFKSYCGICLGIFDYDRMGLQEIDDTLVPLPDSKTAESFMVIHRGVLAMLGYNDDVMDTFWNTLGINAYLLIPSAVLAHNDFVARDAEKRLDGLLKNLRFEKSHPSISQLFKERNYIDDLLNDDILGDVFQYKTEQELYKEGMTRRGISERIKDGKSKLEQLDKLIADKKEERTALNQKIIQVFLTLLSLVSLYTPLRDFYVDEIGRKMTIAETKDFIAGDVKEIKKLSVPTESQAGDSIVSKDMVSEKITAPEDTIKIELGEKQNAVVDWERHSAVDFFRDFFSSFGKKEWLLPKNALDAAHRHILIFSIIILLLSISSIVFSPASLVYKLWHRATRKSRKLPLPKTRQKRFVK